MSSSLIITLEISLVLGVVLVLGGWELYTLRRDMARDRAKQPAPSADTVDAADSTDAMDFADRAPPAA